MMNRQQYETKTLLVTVKTYPTPSKKYIETTCVSGLTDDGHWIRLHPVNFRTLEEESRFPRYSWIRVRVNKSTQDHRPESYHLDIDNIEHLRKVSTTNEWHERRSIIEPMLSTTVPLKSGQAEEANDGSAGNKTCSRRAHTPSLTQR
jgi:hypothetical protein